MTTGPAAAHLPQRTKIMLKVSLVSLFLLTLGTLTLAAASLPVEAPVQTALVAQ